MGSFVHLSRNAETIISSILVRSETVLFSILEYIILNKLQIYISVPLLALLLKFEGTSPQSYQDVSGNYTSNVNLLNIT